MLIHREMVSKIKIKMENKEGELLTEIATRTVSLASM